MLAQILFFAFPLLVVFAGISDMMTMTISNRFSLALIALFLVAIPFVTGWDPATWAEHLLAGAIMLVVAFAMFAFGWVGGGDAKLSVAIALWLGLPQLLAFVVLASLFGGALTLGLLGFRNVPIPPAAIRLPWIVRLHDLKDGIPYGMALSAAGLVLYPQTIWLGLLH
ncbi:prepilin peptidase CpaA [Breoghania corrubedonensis]|uniref:Prepilin peptidase CpaA n=1 Tax=Breoghania corrubedonensis TaxID=665038 RepID=A0A2T5VG23_9HYPH|nr:prepilin peptidase [Breoghania corrubedonensis]PTW62707.1 prepilin peptidase CpaA [Breoghania corrubedonensis]